MLRNILKSVKEKYEPFLNQGVYEIPYVVFYTSAKLVKPLKQRIKEHIMDTIHNQISKSAIAEDSTKNQEAYFFSSNKLNFLPKPNISLLDPLEK